MIISVNFALSFLAIKNLTVLVVVCVLARKDVFETWLKL